MARETRPYISYLLRLWQIKSQGSPVWRASLEEPHTGQRRGFASLEDLFDFLRQETGEASASKESE
jgi:hypothetical protein